MRCKKIDIILTDGGKESFENVEWNDSQYGISICPTLGTYVFWPFYQVRKVTGILGER